MTARLLMEHLESTQINLYLLFLVLVAFDLFRRRRQALGGLALATAISARAVPILFLAYLVYKRAWRPAVWTSGFLVVLNVVLPLIVFGPAVTVERWREWRAVAAAETANPTPMFPNQSLLAALRRVLTREGGVRDPIQYAVAAWPPARVVQLFYALVGWEPSRLRSRFVTTLPPSTTRPCSASWRWDSASCRSFLHWRGRRTSSRCWRGTG